MPDSGASGSLLSRGKDVAMSEYTGGLLGQLTCHFMEAIKGHEEYYAKALIQQWNGDIESINKALDRWTSKAAAGNETRDRNCPLRHANGNCLPLGGFCTSISDELCCAFRNAYNSGWYDACIKMKEAGDGYLPNVAF